MARLIGVFLVIGIALMGCDTLTPKQCENGNWFDIGVRDGQNGQAVNRIDLHGEACAKVGVAPDKVAWLKGRIEGLKSYCTPAKAYNIGRNGQSIRQVCSAEAVALMLPAFEHGREYYEIGLEIGDLEAEISAIRQRIFEAGAEISPELLAEYEFQIRRLDSRIFRLETRQRRYSRWPV